MPSNLKQYLDYYGALDAPGYAVLVSGAWGSGKTYQVKDAIPEEDRYYVSLFGLQSASEIHSEVFAAYDPVLTKTKELLLGGTEGAKNVGGLLGVAGGAASGVVRSVFRQNIKPDRVLIFDDFERCGLKGQDLFGVLNTYVEHHGFRVVIIAHDGEIGDEFVSIKEKLIGQTLKIEPQTNEAFGVFCDGVSISGAKETIRLYRDVILTVFQKSKVESLRVLRHALEDLARLLNCLEPVHIESSDAMDELVRLFVALSIAVRNGTLKVEDLANREKEHAEYQLSGYAEPEGYVKPKLQSENEKYAEVNLNSSLLSSKLLVQMLIEGQFDCSEICSSLNAHPHFIDPVEAKPWFVIWHFRTYEDNIIDAAVSKMGQQFENREIEIAGEMLHMFALRMEMANLGVIDSSVENEFEKSKSYIDDLLEQNKLPPLGDVWELGPYDDFSGDYGGYAYSTTVATKGKFSELWDYLVEQQKQASIKSFPEVTRMLLGLMQTDSQAFYEQVASTGNGPNPYAQIPVLRGITAENFVDTWLLSPKENWKYISFALDDRYSHHRLSDELQEERVWIGEVKSLMAERAEAETGFQKKRIQNAFPSKLKTLLENPDSQL